jgi:hypothetical protein
MNNVHNYDSYTGVLFYKLQRVKNVVFWDIETQFIRHRNHITSPIASRAG